MLSNTSRWSHARGNEVVPSRWQATNGIDGITSWSSWAEAAGVAWTPTTNTRSGGQHVYFRCADRFGNRAGLLDGVDVRGDGGYVVAYDMPPPLAELPVLPDPVKELLTPKTPTVLRGEFRVLIGEATPYGRKALTDELEVLAAARPGSRNHTLNTVALKLGRVIGAGQLREADVREQLAQVSRHIGLGSMEAAKTIESGLRAGMAQPRHVDENRIPGDPVKACTAELIPVEEEVAAPPFPDPIPLVPAVPNVGFPVDALPDELGAMVEAVAEATQTDPAMAATSALTVLAAAACGRAELEARSGWREPLSLFTATVAGPGERKSAVQMMMTRPLLEAETELASTGAGLRREAETIAAVAAKAAEKALALAGREPDQAKRDKLTADAAGAADMAAAAAAAVPSIPRLFADDVTPEATASLLAEQGGRLAILSAEGGIFDVLAGRYSSLPNLDVFLKGHAGDPLRVDRRGRDPEYVRRPCLTVGLMIQPTILASIGRHQQFRGRGLLARFLYAVPVSRVGRRRAGATPVPDDVRAAYETTIRALVEGLAQWHDPMVLPLAVEARQLLIDTERAIEPQLGPDGSLGALADWGSKLLGAILRITGLLHLADHGADRAIRTPVSRACLERGIIIGGYFRAQAIGAFGEMQTDQATADALYLLDRLRRHNDDEISVRDMQRLAKRFKGRAELDGPIQRLVDHGWLIPMESEPTGGRRSEKYRVHPHAHEEGTQGTKGTQAPNPDRSGTSGPSVPMSGGKA